MLEGPADPDADHLGPVPGGAADVVERLDPAGVAVGDGAADVGGQVGPLAEGLEVPEALRGLGGAALVLLPVGLRNLAVGGEFHLTKSQFGPNFYIGNGPQADGGYVALREGRTLHHDIAGRHGAGRVYLRAAPAGTGIIAGGPMRAVFETLGIQDVVAKSIGSSNPYNMVRATFDALKHLDSPRSVAARRNLKVSTLQARRVGGDAEVVAD